MMDENAPGISNRELLEEVKQLRMDMKEMYWQMLLKFNEQFIGLQNQMKFLNQHLVLLNSSKTLIVNSEDLFLGKVGNQNSAGEHSKPQWTGINGSTPETMHKTSESDDTLFDDEKESDQPPVVLEVTTSNTGELNEIMKDENLNSTESEHIREDLEQDNIDTVSPFNCMSRHMYEESSHIANCRDRHCMLCRSLCVTDQDSSKVQKKSPWRCAICMKYFRRRYNLKNHMRCHTGEKPYQCRTCNKFFRSKQSLNYHCHNKHDPKFKEKLLKKKVEQDTSHPQVCLLFKCNIARIYMYVSWTIYNKPIFVCLMVNDKCKFYRRNPLRPKTIFLGFSGLKHTSAFSLELLPIRVDLR